jgi:hypothetical protein
MKKLFSVPSSGSSVSRQLLGCPTFCPFVLFFAILLVCQPVSAFAGQKFKEKMHVSISMKSNWDHGYPETNVRQVGSYFVQVSGEVELSERDGDFLRYVSKNVNATYKFEDRGIMMAPGDQCTGKVISKAETSGSAPVTGDGFFIDVKLGELGKFALLQCGGKITSENIQNLNKMPPSDNYSAVLLVPVKMTYRSTSDSGCELTNVKSGEAAFSLFIGFRELKPWGMSGSYKWGGQGGARTLGVVDCQGDIRYQPEAGDGPPQYEVSWVFGEVKPIVRIYWKDKDITDTESEETIVGRKVKLEARVFPAGYGRPTGKWEIGGKIVSGWKADKNHAELKPFEDFDKSEIEFFWVDGKFAGAPQKVKYTGKVNGKDIEAKATIQVFKPKIKSEKVMPAKMITLGGMIDKKGQIPQCHLYPGNVNIGTWPPVASPPGIYISHEIEMPPTDNQPPHLLQYAQLVKEDVLENLNGEYWRRYNSKWCHDERYPYGGIRASFKVAMDDTPGSDLGQLTKELHEKDNFMTYLMFIPSSNPSDKDAIWVPLSLIEWEWAAGVKKGENLPLDSPCSKKTYRPLYEVPPIVKNKNIAPAYPEWSCNIEDNKKKKIGTEGFTDDKWNDLKNKIKHF